MSTIPAESSAQSLARWENEGGAIREDRVVHAFNEMIDRLETERRESGRRALAAQEAKRLRIAHGEPLRVGA